MNNWIGTLHLLNVMLDYNVNKIVFFSTGATYDNPSSVQIKEDLMQIPANPYGESKLFFIYKRYID